MKDDSRYAQRGVSSGKEEVHKAIKNIDKGLFPKAFCKIVPDYLSNSDDHCIELRSILEDLDLNKMIYIIYCKIIVWG